MGTPDLSRGGVKEDDAQEVELDPSVPSIVDSHGGKDKAKCSRSIAKLGSLTKSVHVPGRPARRETGEPKYHERSIFSPSARIGGL